MYRFWHTCGIFSFAFVVHMHNVRFKNLKYILQWSGSNNQPNLYLGTGVNSFIKRNCNFTNCFVTANKNFFADVVDYDAIVFDTIDIQDMTKVDFPQVRYPEQIYILTATESAYEVPICKKYLDQYFNLTWTYKLNSDLPRPHLRVYNRNGNIVGPRVNMKWPKNLMPLTESMKRILLLKSDAAAWFVNDECITSSKRESFVHRVQEELNIYGWTVDIFGRCSKRQCSEYDPYCLEMLKRDYYFYFAFESSFADDYVTTNVVTALNNYVVPVVYGGADYSSFLPPGSYLNARRLGPVRLAKRMVSIIENPNVYHDFFRWRNHFRIEENVLSEDVCGLCALVNNGGRRKTTYRNIRAWFNTRTKQCI